MHVVQLITNRLIYCSFSLYFFLRFYFSLCDSPSIIQRSLKYTQCVGGAGKRLPRCDLSVVWSGFSLICTSAGVCATLHRPALGRQKTQGLIARGIGPPQSAATTINTTLCSLLDVHQAGLLLDLVMRCFVYIWCARFRVGLFSFCYMVYCGIEADAWLNVCMIVTWRNLLKHKVTLEMGRFQNSVI